MTPDEPELRLVPEAPKGEAAPQGWRKSRLMQAVAAAALVTIALGTVGVLLSRGGRNTPHQAVASTSRFAPPTASPITLPTTVQLSAPTANVLWALVANSALFRSTDKGSSWEQRSLPSEAGESSRLISSFVDDRQGWLQTTGPPETHCAAPLWHTADGAATWQQINQMQCYYDLSFVDSLNGFFSSTSYTGKPEIVVTTNGGRNLSWSGFLLDPPDFITPPGFALRAGAVKRFGKTLYVPAWDKQSRDISDRKYIFRSTDGGWNWTMLTGIPSRNIVMVTESRWLQLLVPGQSMESTNSGQQWHPYDSDFSPDTPVGGPQLVFADSQVGYAEGRGQLQRTVDGGTHWTRIATPGIAGVPLRVSQGDSFAGCRGIDPSHKLAIVRMPGDITNYIRDVTDIAHPVNVCSFPNLGGTPRFVTATKLSTSTMFGIHEFDTGTGKITSLVELPRTSDAVFEYDISADGSSVAYATYNQDAAKGRLTFHLVRSGTDRVLGDLPIEFATFPRLRIEFSPSGKYFAFGASSFGADEFLPLQVRTLDGGLAFSATGYDAMSWGSGDQLYFDTNDGVHRWNGGSEAPLVITTHWFNPSASPDWQHIAYDVYGETHLLDVQSGVRLNLGLSSTPIFLTDQLILHTHYMPNGPYRPTPEQRIYDLSERSDVKSALATVFSTWPRGTSALASMNG
jgi:photosystem II stability/assembly factor-like uncharacterized protein